MDWIKKVQEKEADFLKIIYKKGEYFYAKDIVQEFYIKLMLYSSEEKVFKNGKLNMGYLYHVLKNIFLNYQNEKNKIQKINADDVQLSVNYDYYDGDTSRELELQIQEQISSWSYFDRELFKLYTGICDEHRSDSISIRSIADGSRISTKTIFYTLKRCKQKIREELGDEYADYLNKQKKKQIK